MNTIRVSKLEEVARQLKWLQRVSSPNGLPDRNPTPFQFHDAGAAFAFGVAAGLLEDVLRGKDHP